MLIDKLAPAVVAKAEADGLILPRPAPPSPHAPSPDPNGASLLARLAEQQAPARPLIDPKYTIELIKIDLGLPPIDERVVAERYPRYDDHTDEQLALEHAVARTAIGRLRAAQGTHPAELESLGSGRLVDGCPVNLEHDMIAERMSEVRSFRAACMSGCTPEAIRDAARRKITEREAEDLRSVENDASAIASAEADQLAAELAPRTDVAEEQPWLVRGIVPARAATLLVGRSGHGKNWWSGYLALCVASGTPFFDEPVERGPVLWASLESRTINERHLKHLARSLGLSVDDLHAAGMWTSGQPGSRSSSTIRALAPSSRGTFG